jgi:hypothetical protein
MKRKSILVPAVLALSLFFTAGCDNKDDDPVVNDEIYTISATMAGTNEVPANTSSATGTTTGTYNATTNTLQYNISWSGLTGPATIGHFHGPAAAGTNASPIIYFNLIPGTPNTSGTATGQIKLSDTQEADFLAGKWYANVHTTANSGGEIRGQVSAVK